MNKWLKLITLLGCFIMTATMANDLPADKPDELAEKLATKQENPATTPWTQLQLVGKGKLKVLFWDIYNAELYTADGRYEETQYPIALKLQYLRDFSKKDLIKETEKQWKKLGFNDKDKIATWLTTLDTMWQDVNENDAITLYIDAERSSYFYFNHAQLGKINDPEFARAFLDIWLSENTSAPEVRKKLIS